MSITLCGKALDYYNLAISNIWVALKAPDGTVSFAQSDIKGTYCFENLSQSGTFEVFELNELSPPPIDYPLLSHDLPIGYNANLSPRHYAVIVTDADILENHKIYIKDFIHTYHEPFITSPDAYILNTKDYHLYTLNLITGKSTSLFPLDSEIFYSTLSYHPLEDFLFAYNKHTHTIDKFGPSGLLHSYKIQNLPTKDFVVSTFDRDGNLFLYELLDHTLYQVNLNTLSLDYLSFTTYDIQPINSMSFGFHPITQKLYSLNLQGQVIEISFKNNTITILPTVGTPSLAHYQLVFDYKGYLYLLSAQSDIIYRITLSDNFEEAVCEIFSNTQSSHLFKNPLTRCHMAPLYLHLGSAPEPYITNLSDNGPRHAKTNLLSLELQDSPKPLLLTQDTYLLTANVSNQTDKTAYLFGWIDYNQNGIFEPSEALTPVSIPSLSTKKQVVTMTFTLPDKQSIHLGESYLRLRLTTDKLELSPLIPTLHDPRSLGACSDGSVIDTPITLTSLPPYVSDKQYHKTLAETPLKNSTAIVDPSKGNIIYTLESSPEHGSIIFDTDTNTWEYTPFANFVGEDVFIFNCTSNISLLSCQVPITISVESGAIHLTLTPSQKESLYNTPVMYTAIIENTGTLAVDHLKFTCAISGGIKFISGTTTINDTSDLSAFPEDGIILGNLLPGELYTITFKASCTDFNLTQFTPLCSVTGAYTLVTSQTSQPLFSEVQASPVYFKNPNLNIELTPNTDSAFVGDTVQFTAKLFNSGDIPLSNIHLSLALPMQLTYSGHLTVDYTTSNEDLLSGYIIRELLPQEHLILQFKCLVTDTSTTPYLSCLLFMKYHYLLNHQQIKSGEQTVESQISISKLLLQTNKSSNKTSVSIGDTFTYTLSFFNKGDLCIDDIIIFENLPPQLQIAEVSINNRLTSNTLSSGLSLHALQPHTTTSVDITYKVLDIPYDNPLIKIPTTARCKIQRNDILSEKVFSEEIIDAYGILITDASLYISTTVEPLEACFNETVTYTTTLCNTGTIPLNEVRIEDLLSPHLKFLDGSVTINQTSTSQSVINGITLKNLTPGEKSIISYQAQILTKDAKEIETQTSAHYTYVQYQSNCLKFGYTSSDPCTLYLHHPDLEITLSTNKEIAFLGDTLTFKAVVHNTGDVDAFNIILTPTLNSCKLIEGSFTINNNLINSFSLNTPITIGNLRVNERATICFKATVVGESYSSYFITYKTMAKFLYPTFNQCMRPSESKSIQLETPFALSTFKQLTLENVLELSPEKPDIETINSAGGQINLLNHYIIETPKGSSEDGQVLSGYKAIIHAILDLTIEYVSSTANQAIHVAHYNIPFSTFVILPPSCSYTSAILPEANIEIISSKLINNRCFFIYSTLLVITKLK